MERYKKKFKEDSYDEITSGIIKMSKLYSDPKKLAKYISQCIDDSLNLRRDYREVIQMIAKNLETGNY